MGYRNELNNIEERFDKQEVNNIQEKKALITRVSALREKLKNLDIEIRELYKQRDKIVNQKL